MHYQNRSTVSSQRHAPRGTRRQIPASLLSRSALRRMVAEMID